jgi:hypothetical protein
MIPKGIETRLHEIVAAISRGDYEEALSKTSTSRCSADDLRATIAKYGRTPVAPPFAQLDVLEHQTGMSGFSIRVPLWTLEEGRSDLELWITARIVGEVALIDLDDLCVP